MSMHLCPVFVTTTSTRKRKSKLTGKQQLSLAAHQQFLDKITGGKRFVAAPMRGFTEAQKASLMDALVAASDAGYTLPAGLKQQENNCTAELIRPHSILIQEDFLAVTRNVNHRKKIKR